MYLACYLINVQLNMCLILGVDMAKDLEVCEVPYGGALIFNNILPHRRYEGIKPIKHNTITIMVSMYHEY